MARNQDADWQAMKFSAWAHSSAPRVPSPILSLSAWRGSLKVAERAEQVLGCWVSLALISTAPCSSCAPRLRLPLRTVTTDPSTDRSVPAALLAQQSFDVGMDRTEPRGASSLHFSLIA
jgi:hypothetical protein